MQIQENVDSPGRRLNTNENFDTFHTQTYLDDQGVAQNLVPGDVYKFRVTARNVVGDSHASSSFSAMAASLPEAPGTPTRVTSDETSITI